MPTNESACCKVTTVSDITKDLSFFTVPDKVYWEKTTNGQQQTAINMISLSRRAFIHIHFK